MGHEVDGFDLTFTARTSWKAERRERGRLIDIVPVTWAESWRGKGIDSRLEVWFKDRAEMERIRVSGEPFVVALAWSQNPEARSAAFRDFSGVFEVAPTGDALSDQSIEVKVLRRIRAGESNSSK